MSDTWAEDRWVRKAPRQFANKSFTHRCFKLRARRDQLQIPVPNSAKAKAFSQEQQSAQWTTVFFISFHQARQAPTHWWSGVEAALLSSADCRIVAIFLFCTLTELLVLTKFWTFLNMVHLHFVFSFSESLCYVLLFSWANKNFIFWQLSNDCQIDRASCFLVSGPPNRKTPYNKHLISLVFSVRTVNYGSSFFFHRFMARALRTWAINRWKKLGP